MNFSDKDHDARSFKYNRRSHSNHSNSFSVSSKQRNWDKSVGNQNLKTYQLAESYNYTKVKKQQQQQQLMSHHFCYEKKLPKRTSKINQITPSSSVSKSIQNNEDYKRRMAKQASAHISEIVGYDYLLTESKEKTKKKPSKVDSLPQELALTTIRCSRPPSRKKTFDFSKQRTVSFIDEVKHTNLCVYCD